MNEPLPIDLTAAVESVVPAKTNGSLIAAVAPLWLRPEDEILDATFGRGLFWTRYTPATLITNDINPDLGADHAYDFRDMPDDWAGLFDVVVFDPPYVPQGGASDAQIEDFRDRYGLRADSTLDGVRDMMLAGLRECVRVTARPDGRLLVKCTDFVHAGRYVNMRHQVVAVALGEGMRQLDEFVHYAGLGPSSGKWSQQLHSRRAHSFLCVFGWREPKTGRAL